MNRYMGKWLLACVLGWMLTTAQAAHVTLVGAHLKHKGHTTRIEFELTQPFYYHLFTLAKPPRLVVDFKHTVLATNLKKLALGTSVIQHLRHAEHQHERLRIVFELKQGVTIKPFMLKPNADHHYGLALDLVTSSHHVHTEKKHAHVKVLHKNKKPKLRKIIVVVDPGHGGKDPGATGPNGLHEKKVVLAISKYLQQDLNEVRGIKADLTRSGDYYITLRDRLRIARKDHADFFIAIHADSFPNRQAKGASIFALSERGATSEAARWLAAKENYSELGGVYLANKSRLLRSVLIDLSQTATITQSLQVGRYVIHALRKVTPLHTERVEQARFVVLKSPDIPSLLVETGFITNPYEEKRLNTRHYQQQLALALERGIRAYFWHHPPPHTLFALEEHGKKYVVKPGDSLSMIAHHYHVTMAAIKKLNGLSRNGVRIGQIIHIPGPTAS